MKFLFDLFPIILFFVAFKLGDIYTATIVATQLLDKSSGFTIATAKLMPCNGSA